MKETCGGLYKQQFQYYVAGDPEKVRTFAAGFMSGQAEKIYLGSCGAAMFRPSPEYAEFVFEIAEQIARTYHLEFVQMEDEIWLYHSSVRFAVMIAARDGRESAVGNFIRGMLTGVPLKEIDYEFHLRKGFGETCDKL